MRPVYDFGHMMTIRARNCLLLVLLLCSAGCRTLQAADVKQVPLWDGETSSTPDGPLVDRYGGPVVHLGTTGIAVGHTTNVVHMGRGAYRAAIAGPVSDYAFFQLALSGFGPSKKYVMTRDIRRFGSLSFWLRNDTGVPFTLKLEIKDYRDSSQHMQFRRYAVPAGSTWRGFSAPLSSRTGWSVVGDPDLQQARFIGFVFEAAAGIALGGSVYVDDVVLVEPGRAMDPATAPLRCVVKQLARRQFDGLWGSRSRIHGLIPLNSAYADIGALNSTSAVVKLLPVACEQKWITLADADAYVTTLVATLNKLMDHARYLPPRYVDWSTLKPGSVGEESPVDAAFLALALYQYEHYRSSAGGSAQLRTQIDDLLARLSFAAFGSQDGWKLAYLYDPPGMTDGSYDGYSGEIWLISLAAHLMPAHSVDITKYYHTGILREKDFLQKPNLAHVVHSDTAFRAPFLQWLFPLFVKLDSLPADNYPDPALATNPRENAVAYQRDAHAWLSQQKRQLFLQPDAGDDGSGHKYEQYSCYNDFGESDLFMPWSASFSLLAEPAFAERAIRNHLAHGLHGPFGLSDSVHWKTNEPDPYQVTARCDFWNVSLSTMAMCTFLFHDNSRLAEIPDVRAALKKVFPQP